MPDSIFVPIRLSDALIPQSRRPIQTLVDAVDRGMSSWGIVSTAGLEAVWSLMREDRVDYVDNQNGARFLGMAVLYATQTSQRFSVVWFSPPDLTGIDTVGFWRSIKDRSLKLYYPAGLEDIYTLRLEQCRLDNEIKEMKYAQRRESVQATFGG